MASFPFDIKPFLNHSKELSELIPLKTIHSVSIVQVFSYFQIIGSSDNVQIIVLMPSTHEVLRTKGM